MTPFPLAFRNLVSRNIPQLTQEDIDRYESLVAFRHQLILEENYEQLQPNQPSQNHIPHGKAQDDKSPTPGHPRQTQPRPVPNASIRNVNKQANDIVRPFKEEYEAVVRLWNARRRVAVRQRHYGQIPDTAQRFKELAAAHVNYRAVQIQTFPILLKNRLKFYIESLSPKGILLILVLVIFVGLGLRALLLPIEKPQPDGGAVAPPDSTVQSQPAPVDSLK